MPGSYWAGTTSSASPNRGHGVGFFDAFNPEVQGIFVAEKDHPSVTRVRAVREWQTRKPR